MFMLDLLGAGLTLITLLFLLLSGYLTACLLLGGDATGDPLALAAGTLLSATGVAGFLGLLLGELGLLRIEIAFALLAGLTLLLLRRARAAGGDPWAPGRLLASRVWARVSEHPALSLIAFHGLATEGLRGLLRPPLSWDSLMYHLQIAATWLQTQRIAPVFGAKPMNFYGYQPESASLWVWWWMAPSHSEIYVNLAFFPQALLLALAAGGVARELGARRSWPVVAFLSLLVPVVLRFAATQYVDIFVGATLVAAVFFALRWLRSPRWADALLAGAGLGLAASSKVLGLAYALTLAPVAVAVARGEWRRRLPQAAAAVAVFALLGSPLYLQNVAAGAGPLGARCDDGPGMAGVKVAPSIPRANTVAALFPQMIDEGWLVDSFLGASYPGSLELGVGPQVVLLFAAFLLPWRVRGLERRGAWLVWSQIVFQIFIWVTVPYASSAHVFANVRYLIGAIALCFAGAVVVAERLDLSGLSGRWISVLGIALAVQDLLMLHTEMSRGVRLALAGADGLAVAIALSPRLRGFVVQRRRPLLAAAVVVALLLSPLLARMRGWDRSRAFAQEFTAHTTTAHVFAAGWDWLDRFGGNGTVAVKMTPMDFFVYPAMGLHLERRAIYVNVNRRDSRNAADYPNCDPRIDPDPQAWVENLAKQDVRWLLVSRFPQIDYPVEYHWALARPDLFAQRFKDRPDTNSIFEFLPWQARHPQP